MRLIGLAVVLAISLILTPLAAETQTTGKLARIGVIVPGSPPLPHFEAFKEGLRDLGYVQGQTIVVEPRWDEGRQDQYASLVGDLIHVKVDIIVAGSTQSAFAAKRATQTIPIVMTANADPVKLGLVASLARPGGNVTGMSLVAAELSAKRIEILAAAVPRLSRVVVIWNPENPISAPLLQETQAAARSLAVQVQPLEVRKPGDLESAFPVAVRSGAQALLTVQDAMFSLQRRRIAELALKNLIPTMSGETGFAAAGGLMNYGPDIVNSWRRSAVYVDKILKGAKPGDLPIEQPTKFELVINLKTAKALSLTIR
jgi:putative ABC transport system substrate-binding protein